MGPRSPFLIVNRILRSIEFITVRIGYRVTVLSEGNSVDDLVELLVVLPPQQLEGLCIIGVLRND